MMQLIRLSLIVHFVMQQYLYWLTGIAARIQSLLPELLKIDKHQLSCF